MNGGNLRKEILFFFFVIADLLDFIHIPFISDFLFTLPTVGDIFREWFDGAVDIIQSAFILIATENPILALLNLDFFLSPPFDYFPSYTALYAIMHYLPKYFGQRRGSPLDEVVV